MMGRSYKPEYDLFYLILRKNFIVIEMLDLGLSRNPKSYIAGLELPIKGLRLFGFF